MLSYIRGQLAEVNYDYIVVDVNGLGYQIYLSGNSLNELPNIGDMLMIHTYLYIREDIMMLYGFVRKDELDLFKKLITVSGIGPKGAIAILSALTTDDLRFAILAGDSKAISKANGVGAKTAQRVCLELKDKIDLEDAFEQKLSNTSAGQSAVSSVKNDAIMSLVALGYSETESLKAVSKISIDENDTAEDLIKKALKHLALF